MRKELETKSDGEITLFRLLEPPNDSMSLWTIICAWLALKDDS